MPSEERDLPTTQERRQTRRSAIDVSVIHGVATFVQRVRETPTTARRSTVAPNQQQAIQGSVRDRVRTRRDSVITLLRGRGGIDEK